MENVTHTLLGIALGHVIAGRLPRASRKHLTNAVLVTSVLANNAPDLDVVLPSVLGGGQLGYLLQHRGYTHTLLAAPLLGLLAAAISFLVFRKNLGSWRERLCLIGTGLLGVCLHLLADSWNDYGVHPFWPLDPQWYFGGTIFIVEPLIWFALIPLAVDVLGSWLYRGIFSVLWLCMFGMVWLKNLIPWQISIFLTVLALLMVFVQRRFRGQAFTGGLIVCTFMAVNSFCWSLARARVLEAFTRQRPTEHLTDLSLTPAPSNPACWRVVTASVEPNQKGGPEYRARVGMVSLLPEVFDPQTCFLGPQSGQTRAMPTRLLSFTSNAEIHWEAEYHEDIGKLWRIAQENCRFHAYFRWVRFPFLAKIGDEILAGDARYDRGRNSVFALIGLDPKLGCPSFLPSWDEPFWRRIRERPGQKPLEGKAFQ